MKRFSQLPEGVQFILVALALFFGGLLVFWAFCQMIDVLPWPDWNWSGETETRVTVEVPR